MTTPDLDPIASYKKRASLRLVVILVLVALAMIETSTFLEQYHIGRETGELRHTRVTRTHITIEPWMTFNYVNILYNLPNGYLRDVLQIGDLKYPNTELRRYAKEKNIDQAIFIGQVYAAIEKYNDVAS